MGAEAIEPFNTPGRPAPPSSSRKNAGDPATIGRYRVISTLGAGASGTVYACHDPLLERNVAVKLLHPDLPASSRAVTLERFRLELRMLGRVNHPYVVGVFDASAEGERPYLVMEMCSGPTLAGWLSKQGRIPPGQAALIFHQAALALDHIHAMGIVHRDVKPANFLFQHKSLKLTDFGVALLTAAPPASEGLVGTPGYMSPEQFAGEPVSGRSDLFSLAALLFELLSGRPPFSGDPASVLYDRVFDRPPTLTDEAPDLPPDFDAFLARALARDPAQRYESGAAMCAALSQIVPEHELEMVAGAAGSGLSLHTPPQTAYGYGRAPRAAVAYLPSRPLREKPPPPVPERDRISGAAPAPWQRSEPARVKPDILEFGETLRGGVPGAARLPAIPRYHPKVTVSPPPAPEDGDTLRSLAPVVEQSPPSPVERPGPWASMRWLLGAAAGVAVALGMWGTKPASSPVPLSSYSAALQPMRSVASFQASSLQAAGLAIGRAAGHAISSQTIEGHRTVESISMHIQHHRPEKAVADVPLKLRAVLLGAPPGATLSVWVHGPDQAWHPLSGRRTVESGRQTLEFELHPTPGSLEYRLQADGAQDGSSLTATYRLEVQPVP